MSDAKDPRCMVQGRDGAPVVEHVHFKGTKVCLCPDERTDTQACSPRRGWILQVWFATSSGYRSLHSFASQAEAEREGRSYFSDSRGIRIVTPDLRVLQLKGNVETQCLACQEHYGDAGACDEGKPVNSPHRNGS